MPVPVLHRRLAPPPTGIPTRDLVAWSRLHFPNTLNDSENVFTANWTRARIYGRNGILPDPFTGAYTTQKYISDETPANSHRWGQGGTAPAAGQPVTVETVAKYGGFQYLHHNWSTDNKWAAFDLLAGTVADQAGVSSAITALAGGWYKCRSTRTPTSATFLWNIAPIGNPGDYTAAGYQGACQAGGSATRAILPAGAHATDDIYNGQEIIFSDAITTIHTVTDYNGTTKACDFTPARGSVPDGKIMTVGPGVYVARMQRYPGPTLPGYVTTTNLQSESGLLDKTRNGNHLSRGSNASAADSSDPSILGRGLGCVDDDYAKTPQMSISSFTAVIALRSQFDGVSYLWSLESGGTPYAAVYADDATHLKLRLNAAADKTSSGLLIADETDYLLAISAPAGGDGTLTRLDTMASVKTSGAGWNGASLTEFLGALNAGSQANDVSIYERLLYKRVLPATELQRIRRAVKSFWTPWGVNLQ